MTAAAPGAADRSPAAAPGAAGRAVARVQFVSGGLNDTSVCHSVLRLARELRHRGVEVAVACGGGCLLPAFERAGIPTLVVSRLATARWPLLMPRALVEQVRAFEPDLLHFFGRPLAAWAASLAARTGKPYVLTIATFPEPGQRVKVPGDWRRGSLMAVSEELREELVNRAHIPKDAIAVIPVGIAFEEYQRYQAAGDPALVPVVGTVGPLTPERGCEYFVRAAKEVLERGHSAQFLVAGDGPELPRLRRLIRELGIGKSVTIAEAVPDYRAVLAMLDICVIPTVRECLGLDVLEAMACRRPVVAAGAGPACSLIREGETGLLAPKKDPAAIAEQVVRLLQEPPLASKLVEAAYRMVRDHYSVQATTERLLDFYAKCLGKATPS